MSEEKAAKVFLGEDKILRVEIDLNVPDGKEIEGRIGAYGTLKWAEDIVNRFFSIKEMNLAKQAAVLKETKGIVRLNPKLPN